MAEEFEDATYLDREVIIRVTIPIIVHPTPFITIKVFRVQTVLGQRKDIHARYTLIAAENSEGRAITILERAGEVDNEVFVLRPSAIQDRLWSRFRSAGDLIDPAWLQVSPIFVVDTVRVMDVAVLYFIVLGLVPRILEVLRF